MSTIVSFMPMNVRLYDRDERELRTYVSPSFSCVENEGDDRGMSCHIVADNGGGKSTLLLFLEMLFCKPDRNGPAVGHKKAIDYLRRASAELDDNTPTSMAALVRRDDPSLMHSARDVIFGYSVGLRGADGAALDLRRFVIHLDENPGFTLDALARDYIYDSTKSDEAPRPRTLRNVWERLRELPGCRLFESSEWDEYAREMTEAGVSPILWRELARMNQDEEAAGDYFATGDAFKKIVNLVSESLEPMSGERRKPLAETAATIARQVSEQSQDRRREKACGEAAGAVASLAEQVRTFAEAREALKLTEDEAHLVARSLGETCRELDERIDYLMEAEESYRLLRRRNDQLRVSSRIFELERGVSELQARADELQAERKDRRAVADEATRAVALDDAAKSRRRWLAFDAEIKAQEETVAVLEGKMERDEELARARSRAWAGSDQVSRATHERLRQAEDALARAREKEAQANQAKVAADAELGRQMLALGQAQARLESAKARLGEAATDVGGLDTVQVSLQGLFSEPSLAGLIRKAQEHERACAQATEAASAEVTASTTRLEDAREELRDAEVELSAASADAQTWEHNLDVTEAAERRLREAVSLFEDVSGHVLAGRYEEAIRSADAQRASFEDNARDEEERSRVQVSRLRALEEGRLDTTEALRAWLDRHGVRARTLSGHKGVPREVADALFEKSPWLAHALVVDGPALKALERAAAEDDPAELGHPVFYIEQADIQGLIDALREGHTLPETTDGTPLLHALPTVERTSVEDAEGFAEELRRRSEAHLARAASARGMAERLRQAHDLIRGFETTLAAFGMEAGSTLADVAERTRVAEEAKHTAEHRLEEARGRERQAQAALEKAHQRLEAAMAARDDAQGHIRALETVRNLNAEAQEAARGHDEAQRLERETRARKEAAETAYENARSHRRSCEDTLGRGRREAERTDALAARLSALSRRPEEHEPLPESAPATIAELEAAIDALDAILSRIDADLHGATERLLGLREHREAELGWQDAIQDAEAEGIPFTLQDVDAWVPADRFERRRLLDRKRDARADAREADRRYNEANNLLQIRDGERKRAYRDLSALGLDEPLEVPDDYDHAAEAARISAEERADREALSSTREDREQLGALMAQADLAAERASRDDGYRASGVVGIPTFTDLAGRKTHVEGLLGRQRKSARALEDAIRTLDARTEEARTTTELADEHQVARNVADSVRTVKGTCTTKASIQKVALELDSRSEMLRSMALTLSNRLRATNESIEDLVAQAVAEGYKLTTELHRLSLVSRASIKGSRPQRTIDFRSRGRTVFVEEFHRDEVATARLAHQVRSLIVEKLPRIEEGRRLERAEARLAPHELVYLLLDDRSVDVRYPVIRGGARLSYESTRDTSGSGSTGQKSAGYVLSFLALLRYLGNVGALSAENSLFVALENQFGKISSTSIIADIKEVTEQTHMQLITVAGRELRSAYAMGDVVFALYRTRGTTSASARNVSAMRARRDDDETPIHDSIIDRFRATRSFENLSFDF